MLEGFFVIESWRTDAKHLTVRLVPDHFQEALVDPVVTVCIAELQDPAESEAALLQRKGELIVALEVSEGLAVVYAEHDDEPALLRGSVVSVTRGPYSFEDLRRIIQQFVCELIRRAEIKRELTSRGSAPLDLEVDVLQRVLHRIRDR